MTIEEILIVRHDGNLFGINTDAIEHILRVLDITPLPYSPKEVRGFCSIEGSILTVLDLSRLLLNENNIDETKEAARLISVSVKNKHYAVLLEEVINNITVNPEDIDYVSEEDQRRDGVVAAYKYNGEIIQVLELERLIANIKKLSFDKREVSEKYALETVAKVSENRHRRYFLFMMADEQYAIDVNKIREVISVPDVFTEMADVGEEVLGMMTLREEIVVTIDLRMIYDLKAERKSDNRIIVVQLEGKVAGLLIDSIVDIADFDASDIDAMPSNFKDKKIEGIAHRNNELISLVNIDVINELINAESRVDNAVTKNDANLETVELVEVVSFYLDGKSYALHTEYIIEIIDTFEVTNVSDMPEMVHGITNIRGKVIPVVSLYDKLNLRINEKIDQHMLVCQFQGNNIGILVDAVKDVSNIPKSQFLIEEDSEYFSEVIKVNETDVMLMINLENVLK